MAHDIHIIGGGLAGSEAAWQLARRGFAVRLSEMRGGGGSTPAHQTDGLAELVCSNSFRSDDDEKNAVGLLHHEMRRLDSLVMRAGEVARVPAGSAMAVDRDVFSAEVQRELEALPNLEVVRETIDALPEVAGRNPVRIRIVVLLPAPLGPRNPTISPFSTSKLRSRIAVKPA